MNAANRSLLGEFLSLAVVVYIQCNINMQIITTQGEVAVSSFHAERTQQPEADVPIHPS